MKILNLYAGLGGNRKQWNGHEITAIEYDPIIAAGYSKNFPKDTIFIQDAHDFIRNKAINLNNYNFIWASPPCQTHSQMMKWYKNKYKHRPIPHMNEIYGLLTWLPIHYKNYFCIENVQPWYKCIIKPTFRIKRHIFYANFHVPSDNKKLNKWKGKKIGGVVRQKATQTERNMVDGWIGKYILDQVPTKKLIDYFI